MNDEAAPQLPRDPARAHWLFWEFGLLSALAAIVATPAESLYHTLFGIVCLLFLLGLANQDRNEI